ncbi:Quinoprotein glucose dehydrogenase B precursor [compost metagenome]
MGLKRGWVLVPASLLAIACAGGEGGSPASPGDSAHAAITPGAVSIERVFPKFSFERPTDLQAPSDGTNRLFVLEQPGRIRVFGNRPDPEAAATFLDISDRVDDSGNEMGLLGLAFDPDYKTNRTFYVNYTAGNPRRTVISRFKATEADANKADPASEEVVLTFDQPYSNHNGGQLAFGPDGMLYIGTGDGGSGGDPHNNGQRRDTLLGKWLRIDVHQSAGGQKYAIPPDNPFVGQANMRGEIYAYGLRNLWRFSHDREANRWYGADVGQNKLEEVNVLEKGKNYGWKIMEASDCFEAANCDKTGLTLPIAEYGRNQGVSVTGGYVYRGARLPALQGTYMYADYGSGRIWGLNYDGQKATNKRELLDSDINPATFGQDEARELYIVDHGGAIYRFK